MSRNVRPARPAVVCAPLLAVAVLLSGCSSSEETVALDPDVVNIQAGAPGEPNVVLTEVPVDDEVFPGSPYSDADVDFILDMLAHHEQALAMTALVESRTDREDLRLFVQRMDISQTAELEQLERMIEIHDQAVRSADGDHEDHEGHGGDHTGMPGMLTDDELAELEAATGDDFVRLFLVGMSRHHEGALAMVEELLSTEGAAADPRLYEFAQHVDSDQRIEIDRMARMYAELPEA